jgi:hypothetical protein
MPDIHTEKTWPELYRQALLEADPGLLAERIEQAHKAILFRARELWYSNAHSSRERQDLDAALHFLGLLKSVATHA